MKASAFVVSALLAWPAFGGASSSSGGGAFINSEGTHSIFLDLWENDINNFPEDVFGNRGLHIKYSDADIETQLQNAIFKIASVDSFFAEAVQRNLEIVRDTYIHWTVPDSISLPPPSDAMNDYAPEGYKLAGMFLFHDDEVKLSIKSQVYEALQSETDRAAAWLHEAVYKTLREHHADLPNSSNARRLTACLISEDFETDKCSFTPFNASTRFTHACVSERGSRILAIKGTDWPGSDFLLHMIRGKDVFLTSISGTTRSTLSSYGINEGNFSLEDWSADWISMRILAGRLEMWEKFHCEIIR